MNQSMTAYASQTGSFGAVQWLWEVRSVNARGLDVRLRLPDGCEALDGPIREALKKRIQRGNVTVSLRLTIQERDAASSIDVDQLDRVLAALDRIQDRALEHGVALATPTVTEVLNQRGVMVSGHHGVPSQEALPALQKSIAPLLDDFVEMRRREGNALARIIQGQLQRIAQTLEKCIAAAKARQPATKLAMSRALQRVLGDVAGADEQRIAQELALLAVKQDITEELDRLNTHIAAAEDMLASDRAMGRKLDFLSQEFNREANTLCSKAQNADLTALGLDLKTFIDQMREQIQNLE